MAHFKRNWFTYLLAAAVIFCLWLLLSNGCRTPGNDHKDDRREVLAARDTINKLQAVIDHLADSSKKELARKDSLIAQLRTEKQVTNSQLGYSKTQTQRLAWEVQQLRSESDTSAYARKVDSLLGEVVNLTSLVSNYQVLTDSLSRLTDEQRNSQAALLAQREQLYSQLRSSYDLVNNKYNTLFRDYSQISKSVKKEKLKTKITAAIALAEAVLLLIKK